MATLRCMRKVLGTALLIVLVALASCSSNDELASREPTTTTTSTTTTTVATTTTLTPQRAAQVAYYTIVAETNPAQEAIDERYTAEYGDVYPWSVVPAYCREQATVGERYINLMSTTDWPDEFQAQVTDVIAKQALVVQLELECADTPGTGAALADFNERWTAARDSKNAAVSTLRGILGLPIERG
jgi:hypothetical protein